MDAAPAHVTATCWRILNAMPAMRFSEEQAKLKEYLLNYEKFLATLKTEDGRSAAEPLRALLSAEEGSREFYARANEILEILDNPAPRNIAQKQRLVEALKLLGKPYSATESEVGRAIEDFYNRLLKLVASAKPGPSSPEISHFFRLGHRYMLNDPALREYVLWQILHERKGSAYKSDNDIIPNGDEKIERPKKPWDTLVTSTLLSDSSRLSDHEFAIVKSHLLSREPHEAQNALDILAIATSDGHLSDRQLYETLVYASEIDDASLFGDLITWPVPETHSKVKGYLEQIFRDPSDPMWLPTARALLHPKPSAATIRAVVKLGDSEDPAIARKAISALSALPSIDLLSTRQRNDLKINWGRMLKNAPKKSEIFGAIDWQRIDFWGANLKPGYTAEVHGAFMREVAEDPELAPLATQVARSFKNFKMITDIVERSQGAPAEVLTKVVREVYLFCKPAEIPLEVRQGLEALRSQIPPGPLRQSADYAYQRFRSVD
jgi:hypothetical protein